LLIFSTLFLYFTQRFLADIYQYVLICRFYRKRQVSDHFRNYRRHVSVLENHEMFRVLLKFLLLF
jgi:hypothetical protein